MLRTLSACVVSMMGGVALAASVGLGARPATSHVQSIPVGGTAVFVGQDLLCINEPAAGAPRFHRSGVACSAYVRPYYGAGVWLTRTAIKVTRPPNGKVVAAFSR